MAKSISTETRTGFTWNNVVVDRVCDGAFGTIVAVKSDKGHSLHIRVTPGGKVLLCPTRGQKIK